MLMHFCGARVWAKTGKTPPDCCFFTTACVSATPYGANLWLARHLQDVRRENKFSESQENSEMKKNVQLSLTKSFGKAGDITLAVDDSSLPDTDPLVSVAWKKGFDF